MSTRGATTIPLTKPAAEAAPTKANLRSRQSSRRPIGHRHVIENLHPSKETHWKHPIDSENGGPDDPPKKAPKGSIQGSGGSGSPQGGGWYDQYGHHHGPWPSGQGTASNGEPAPASRTPR